MGALRRDCPRARRCESERRSVSSSAPNGCRCSTQGADRRSARRATKGLAMADVMLRQVSKRFGTTEAVRELSLAIDDGEFVVLLGPSGAGKTTTLRCIAGLEDVSDGAIRFDGKVVSSRQISLPPEQRHIGMVFQSYAVWPHMTVAENVAFGLKL